MIVVGSLAALLVLGALLVPEGEVVTLVTRNAEGRERETQLWVVELDGGLYLRASNPDARWLEQLRSSSRVELARPAFGAMAQGGFQRRPFLARVVEDPALHVRVAAAMEHKYGLADRLWGLFRGRERGVPIRLDALPVGSGDES